MSFASLELSENILRTLAAEGYATPTPIQAQAIPPILAGKDLLGIAQTGTGKTAAFALPIIHHLSHPENRRGPHPAEIPLGEGVELKTAKSARKIKALVLSPTRELATQIEQSFKTYGQGTPLRVLVIFGGVSQHWQVKSLHHGVDILVATPGRLLDLMQQGYVDLRSLKTLVLDEADQMLDMGFIHDIRRIVAKLPEERQSLMFSATMPDPIRELADTILKNPETVAVTPAASTVEKIEQSVRFVEREGKRPMLVDYIKENGITRALVFVRTKHGADKVARFLVANRIESQALHGNKTQGQRERAMKRFKSQAPPILVATDIAARGLDIDDVSHVINFDIPNVPETYVHRIGRTGRAGATGHAVSFCSIDEQPYLADIERLIKQQIPVVGEDPRGARRPRPAQAREAHERPREAAHPREHARTASQAHPHARPQARPHAKPHSGGHARAHTAPHSKPHASHGGGHRAGQHGSAGHRSNTHAPRGPKAHAATGAHSRSGGPAAHPRPAAAGHGNSPFRAKKAHRKGPRPPFGGHPPRKASHSSPHRGGHGGHR